MLTIIVEDAQLHQGLFPGPGTTQNDETGSNKLPKSDFEWMIAERLFAKDETYASTFATSTTTSRGRLQWVTKIKNKLTQLAPLFLSTIQPEFDVAPGCVGLLTSALR